MYEKNYASVAKSTSIRNILALAASLALELYRMDVVMYFSMPNDADAFIRPPPGVKVEDGMMWTLMKCLCVLKPMEGLLLSHYIFGYKLIIATSSVTIGEEVKSSLMARFLMVPGVTIRRGYYLLEAINIFKNLHVYNSDSYGIALQKGIAKDILSTTVSSKTLEVIK